MNNSHQITRPTSLNEWFGRIQNILFPILIKSYEHAAQYEASPTDVFISPYLKCGTTWLQQIVHTLRTHGDMEFDDISRIIPWFENAHAQEIDIRAPQRGKFKAFKSHFSWDAVPKGGRYIVSIRDPKDTLLSMYNFFNGWQFEDGSVSIDEFAMDLFMSSNLGDNYWKHLSSWWEHRHDDNVLLLCYEDMKDDLPSTITAIAKFIDVPLDDGLLKLTLKHSSIEFMLANKDKFDEKITSDLNVRIGLLPPGGESSKVNTGRVGDHKNILSEAICREMDLVWNQEIEKKISIPSYSAMRNVLFRETGLRRSLKKP